MITGSPRLRTVLLIDEDPEDAPRLGETIRTAGVEVIVVPGGAGTTARVWQVAPDLIALDVRIPGDYRLLELGRLRRQRDLRQTPVIVFGPGAHRLPVFSGLVGKVLEVGESLGPAVVLERLAAPELIRSTVHQLLDGWS